MVWVGVFFVHSDVACEFAIPDTQRWKNILHVFGVYQSC